MNFCNLKSKDGSMTVEAAVLLPFIFSVIICLSSFIKVAYTHMVVQHAIVSTANEMAMYGYLYHLSGIEEKNNQLSEKVESILGGIMTDTYEGLKSKTLAPALKLIVENKLKTSSATCAERLKSLGISEGLNFDDSRLFENQKDIHIVVKYKIKISAPINIIPEINITQSAEARAWLGGEPNPGFEKAESSSESVWDMDNFKRGDFIQKALGRNLPKSFPVVCKNINGKIVKISSINCSDKYYSNPEHLKKQIIYYINEIYEFKGAEYGKIKIGPYEIKEKELLIVVPEVKLNQEIQSVLNDCKNYSNKKGVSLLVKAAFGKPKKGD